MDLPRRLFADVVPAFSGGPFGRVVKSAAVADGRTTPPAVLTYPVRDRQGDVVEPGGLSLDEFEGIYERLSNFEHGPYIGTTAVEYKSMPRLDSKGQPDESLGLIALPVGVTTFFESAADAGRHTLRRFDGGGNVVGVYPPDECARLADHLRPLVPGVYGGVSIEFRPDGPEGVAYKSLGPHPLLRGRPAYHFFKSRMIGLAAACDIPVNQFAGYSLPDAETLSRAEKALKYCESAGSLEVIRKSLTPLVRVLKSTPSGRVTAPVRRLPPMSVKTAPKRVTKADGYEDPEDPMIAQEAAADPALEDPKNAAPEPDGDEMKPTPAALFQLAQSLKDACAMANDIAAKGEHVPGKKAIKKFCEQVQAIADKVAAMGDKVAAAVDADDAAELDVDAEIEADAEPAELDDDGGLMAKSFGATKWRPHRTVAVKPGRVTKATPYTLKHMQKAKTVPADGQVVVDAKYLKNLEMIAEAADERLGGSR